MYECLTGHKPYRMGDNNVVTLMTEILNKPAPRLPNKFPKYIRKTMEMML